MIEMVLPDAGHRSKGHSNPGTRAAGPSSSTTRGFTND